MKRFILVAMLAVTAAACAAPTDATTGSDSQDQTSLGAPGWVGGGTTVVDRGACGGEPCTPGAGVPLEKGFGFGDWARQRAELAQGRFEVWKQGVTDHYNPDLWKQLDVQMHYRYGQTGAFASAYVKSDKQVGNNARFTFDLRSYDRLYLPTNITKKEQCPAVPLQIAGADVQAELQYYFTVNGARYPQGTEVFHGFYTAPKQGFVLCPTSP
jgi:hypothetical protein